ncbi:hypothetical protein V2J09_000276 [Rumex salicifolius]
MGTIGHASSRILIKALRLSIFMQFILGFASGVRIPASNGVEHSLEATVANQRGHNNGWHFSFMSKIMFMAVPGMVLFSCAFPCFWRRRRNAQASLHGDPVSMDSGSSFGMTSSSDRILGSPMRYPPQSPMKFPPHSPRFSPKLSKLGPLHLSFNQVAKATQNFSSSACIGEGGFGTVYKGRLPDGQEVAIKRARKDHFDSTEFNSEVDILSKIDHRCLVRLLGCVDRGNERLIITEYVSNGSLRQHLDGERGKSLDFNQRLEISIDITHGLTYLHTYADKQIIHRDVKSSNILLTDNMKAKVADFGFARIGPRDADRTHISTKVKGTVGYLDPEYMRTYQLTTKSDVYSFGILLLEILTGRRPVDPRRPPDERVLIKWAFYNYSEGNIVGIIDPLMQESVNEDILRKMFSLAIQCAAPIRTDRPDMKSVAERLWAVRLDYKSRKG